ncbi:hypothetical protein QFZ82_000216 [Streptomyces sp. V4I23]|nr:hypothetical protein [Streptomyces sp. V4I23]
MLAATCWRTSLTLRQVAPWFRISKSAADRILDHLDPLLTVSPARRPRKDTVYMVEGKLVPTRDRSVSSSSCRYATNLQVVIGVNSRLLVAIGIPLPGSRNNCRAFAESVATEPAAEPVIADGRHQGTWALIPHGKRPGQERLIWRRRRRTRSIAGPEPGWYTLSRLKNWKVLRDCRLRGKGVHQAMLGLARLDNLALTGYIPHGRTSKGRAARRVPGAGCRV